MSGAATQTRPAYKGEGQQLYSLDGLPYCGQPDRVNAMGYPSASGRRLYTAEHLRRRGRPIRQVIPPGALHERADMSGGKAAPDFARSDRVIVSTTHACGGRG